MSELHSLGVPDETHVMNTPAIRPRAMVHRIASYAHLAAVIPALVVPGLGALGAAGVWWVARHLSPVVDEQSRAAVDFQLTVLLLAVVGFVGLTSGLGVPGVAATPWFFAPFFLSVVTPLFAATATSRGEVWRYPLSLRLMQR
ncbi:MAG: DUF4870 domain-containing protein [Algisphaera sp.]